jgi:D-alanyl-lipoteichoic acid acyltransferase DltB (MBOAT superfamily)
MNFCSPWFLLFCVVLVVIFQRLPQKGSRRALLTLANLLFLIPYVPNLWSGIWLALFIVLTYAAVRLIQIRTSGWVLFAIIAIAVAAFVILKQYSFLTVIPIFPATLWERLKPVQVIGLSYMLFKFIHVLVDQREKQLAPISFVTYASYQLSFFTLLAGPLQRYHDFYRFWNEIDTGAVDGSVTLLSWNRILTGCIKMGVVAPLASSAFEHANDALASPVGPGTIGWFLVFFYSYPLYLYFNFAGYTDVAIGIGQLLGCRVPENFNRPFLGRNVVDFWDRWHISMTHWIRDYVFMTSYKAAAERFPRSAKYLGYGLLFLAFFLFGLWHGAVGYGFAVFGVIQGSGAAIAQAYGDTLKSILGRAGYQRYQKNQWIRGLAILLTLHLFFLSQLFFSSGVSVPLRLLRNFRQALLNQAATMSLGQLGLGVLLLVLAVGCFPFLLRRMETVYDIAERRWERLTRATGTLYAIDLVQAVLVTLVLWYVWATEVNETAVIYMRF